MEEKGFRILVLLHLCPIVPFNALNYIAGTTAVPLWTFTFALVAILPGTIVYVFLGSSAGSLAGSSSKHGTSPGEIALIVVGLVLGIVGIGITSYYAKQELDKVRPWIASCSSWLERHSPPHHRYFLLPNTLLDH